MGLITGLLTLPLAPVRGTAWIAGQIREQALNELYDEEAIQSRLMELEELHEAGEIDDDELRQAEDELLERLAAVRGLAEEEGDG
jgi:uncharacterized alpha-E superfamily protein